MTPTEKGWVVSIGFVGMAIGAVCSGGLADKIGRKTVFATTLVIYSLATASLCLCTEFNLVIGLSLYCRFRFGRAASVAVTLVSEYIPAHVRGRFIVLLESFWGLGWLCAALVSYFVIPKFDWHTAFLIGGLPALYALVIWKKVPESIPYLINRGRIAEAHALVQKI